jgi:putative nucleotidyltransferase with HDIG domain
MLNPMKDPPRIAVASGSCVISKGAASILDAYLGTCVGVALCDRHANVGGLIHLLLPEPTGIDSPWQPEVYAATGLPLFIQRLSDKGASKENLEATVAGGALVGDLCKRDLILDIGGRTADVVEKILRQERITIRQSEIGGYFSCRLSLNTRTWECDIAPIGMSSAALNGKDFEKPDLNQIDRAIRSVCPIPQIALKIIRMISDQAYSLEDVAQEFMQDQVMTAKAIRFCNSAFSGMRMQVDSIERALLIVGEKYLLQLIIGAALEEFLSKTDRGYSLCKGGLYQHACGTAIVARSLAQFTGRTPPDLAYTAGLLHDIGKVVLDQCMDAARPLFYRHVQLAKVDLTKAESELFGITHPEVGRRFAMQWSFPENITEAIEHHHRPEEATLEPELTHLVYLADLIMSRFMVGQELEKMNTDALHSRLRKIGLSHEQLPLVVDRAFCAIRGLS